MSPTFLEAKMFGLRLEAGLKVTCTGLARSVAYNFGQAILVLCTCLMDTYLVSSLILRTLYYSIELVLILVALGVATILTHLATFADNPSNYFLELHRNITMILHKGQTIIEIDPLNNPANQAHGNPNPPNHLPQDRVTITRRPTDLVLNCREAPQVVPIMRNCTLVPNRIQ